MCWHHFPGTGGCSSLWPWAYSTLWLALWAVYLVFSLGVTFPLQRPSALPGEMKPAQLPPPRCCLGSDPSPCSRVSLGIHSLRVGQVWVSAQKKIPNLEAWGALKSLGDMESRQEAWMCVGLDEGLGMRMEKLNFPMPRPEMLTEGFMFSYCPLPPLTA